MKSETGNSRLHQNKLMKIDLSISAESSIIQQILCGQHANPAKEVCSNNEENSYEGSELLACM